jgi:hypothetical protein
VIGLISNNDTEFDITKLKAKGIAYIGITADADAAEKYGCSWKVLEKEADPTRQENGLIWDIISQTASLSEKLLGQNCTLESRKRIIHAHIHIRMYLSVSMVLRWMQ